jgi:isoleucyl-tRNA synthetase
MYFASSFEKMFAGLIYMAHRPVFYSPSSRSALAEAELEYVDNHVSTAVYVAFVLDASGNAPIHPKLKALLDEGSRAELLVWTTTPWTLSANMVRSLNIPRHASHTDALTFQAIAVHPELVYAVIRSVSDHECVMIVARDRLEALSGVIVPFEQLFEVSGTFVS